MKILFRRVPQNRIESGASHLLKLQISNIYMKRGCLDPNKTQIGRQLVDFYCICFNDYILVKIFINILLLISFIK